MSYHIICDPVHGIMELESEIKEVIKPIIDTVYFQRLRHIKQLSFAEYAYPGAVHTRFNHCIGVAFLSQCVGNSLKLDELSKDAKIQAVINGLLHDIGHGPFSHSFEDLYPNKKTISHEAWNKYFIKSLIPLLKPKYRKYLRTAIRILDSKEENLKDEEDKILKQMISSQLDVDRFDYLLRDSHFAGVSYGHFDVHWLISCMCRVDHKITVQPKGVRAVEHYLMARRLMNLNVYFHKKKCSAEYLLKVLFQLCQNDLLRIKQELDSPVLEFMSVIKKHIKKEKFESILLEKGFALYSQLTDFSIWDLIYRLKECDDSNIKAIASRFLERDLTFCFSVIEGKEAYTEAKILEVRAECQQDWRICYHNPQLSIYKTKAEEIYVNDSRNGSSFTNVLNHSHILSSFSNKNDSFAFVYFIDGGTRKNELKKIAECVLDLAHENCLCITKVEETELRRIKSGMDKS